MERAGSGDNAEVIDKTRILEYVSGREGIGYQHSKEHDKFIRGAIVTGVGMGLIRASIEECAAVKEFVAEHEYKHGTDPLVFIAAELLWSCHDENQDLSFREFSTACAVNSIIGFKKTPVIIRRSMIQARQLGYKTPAVMAAEIKTSPHSPVKDKPYRKPLSIQQLRDTLEALENRDLFRRCQTSRRTVYFSTTLNRTELVAAAKERVEKKTKVQMLRELDRAIFTKTNGNQTGTNQEPLKKETGEKGTTKGGTTKAGTSQEPDGSQLETSGGTSDGTTSGTTKTNAFEINAPLTNAPKEKLGTDERDSPSSEQISAMLKQLREVIA